MHVGGRTTAPLGGARGRVGVEDCQRRDPVRRIEGDAQSKGATERVAAEHHLVVAEFVHKPRDAGNGSFGTVWLHRFGNVGFTVSKEVHSDDGELLLERLNVCGERRRTGGQPVEKEQRRCAIGTGMDLVADLLLRWT